MDSKELSGFLRFLCNSPASLRHCVSLSPITQEQVLGLTRAAAIYFNPNVHAEQQKNTSIWHQMTPEWWEHRFAQLFIVAAFDEDLLQRFITRVCVFFERIPADVLTEIGLKFSAKFPTDVAYLWNFLSVMSTKPDSGVQREQMIKYLEMHHYFATTTLQSLKQDALLLPFEYVPQLLDPYRVVPYKGSVLVQKSDLSHKDLTKLISIAIRNVLAQRMETLRSWIFPEAPNSLGYATSLIRGSLAHDSGFMDTVSVEKSKTAISVEKLHATLMLPSCTLSLLQARGFNVPAGIFIVSQFLRCNAISQITPRIGFQRPTPMAVASSTQSRSATVAVSDITEQGDLHTRSARVDQLRLELFAGITALGTALGGRIGGSMVAGMTLVDSTLKNALDGVRYYSNLLMAPCMAKTVADALSYRIHPGYHERITLMSYCAACLWPETITQLLLEILLDCAPSPTCATRPEIMNILKAVSSVYRQQATRQTAPTHDIVQSEVVAMETNSSGRGNTAVVPPGYGCRKISGLSRKHDRRSLCPFVACDFGSGSLDTRESVAVDTKAYLEQFLEIEEIDAWAGSCKRFQGDDMLEAATWTCRCVVAAKENWRSKLGVGNVAFETQVVVQPRKRLTWFPRDHEMSTSAPGKRPGDDSAVAICVKN